MAKYLILLPLAAVFACVSCSGGADSTSTADAASVLSEAEAASQAAASITDDATAEQALADLQKQIDG